MFDPHLVRTQFPIFTKPENQSLVYLDNAATSHKPESVLEAMTDYYSTANSNVHRGVHRLSDVSTTAWETARQTIANFFGAKTLELILTRNTTHSLNGVAYGWGDHNIKSGDVLIATQMEHHANLVPWQELAKRTGATLWVCPVTPGGLLDLHAFEEALSEKVKLVSFVHVSNTLGTINPVSTITSMVRKKAPNALIVLDAAQSAPHMPLNFSQIDVDVLAASGHKMLGPMGSGILLVKETLLSSNNFQPWLFGGGMIASVSEQTATYNSDISERFTPGTPDVASAVGLAAACSYLQSLGMDEVYKHDLEITEYALSRLKEDSEISIIGPNTINSASGDHSGDSAQNEKQRLGSVAFIHKRAHAHDVAQILDSEDVAVRSGHHCTMPLHTAFGWQATVRASFQVYTSKEDIDALIEALKKVRKVFG